MARNVKVRKVRIFQPIVPEYRVALFDGVGEHYGDGVEVWASEGSGQDCSYPLNKMRYDYSHGFYHLGPFKWQRGLSIKGLSRGDVVVVCGDLHQISSLWIALKAKICGVKVVWWGHHRTATSNSVGVMIRLLVARLLSDCYLCYTHTGVSYLSARGFDKVFATGNTIDQIPIDKAVEYWDCEKLSEFVQCNGLAGKSVLLCCGVLRPKVCLELAIRALISLENDVLLVVIGDGPMKSTWVNLVRELGLTERVIWVSATRDQLIMAPWFLSAKVFLYPGSIGLGILHSFSYGLPVVTHSNADRQMPEFEVMEEGKTGVLFEESSLPSLVSALNRLLKNEPKRVEMSAYCKLVAHRRYSMKQMILNYCAAIEGVADR